MSSSSPPSGDRWARRLLRFVGDAIRGCRDGASNIPGRIRWLVVSVTVAFYLSGAGHHLIGTVLEVDQHCLRQQHSVQLVEKVCRGVSR